ncbi:helix-turn-helix domain-containing protein [Tissierella pigra]|uniref:helix-turn-helix domain-containing protein n=1 Tax=Tissierella pigra TaxID=2607614 RepID=UPI001C10FD58|nr:helix-turn-helix domain-containing protein [Tissierella pigra]MBU5426305.1 helix-turn-helix domain-containing protein [Tissierella pigra]
MGRKSSFTIDEKLEYIHRCIRGDDSVNHAAKLIGVSNNTLKRWIRNYESLGIDGLNNTSKNTIYSEEVKNMAVRDYLDGKGSLSDICKKYGIKSTKQLRNWILKYNSHEELKSSGTGGIAIMTKGRKTTYEERIEIVKYCIEHQNNYAETAQHFQVSYQQVYSWVTKYEKDGVEALQDRRGKRKSVEEMSELEKLKAENKLLRAENKRKQMELDFLKKLEELERGRY